MGLIDLLSRDRSSPGGQNSQPKWACKTRHFGYGIDFFPQNLKSGHLLHRDRSKGNTNPNGRVKREKSGGKSHEMKAQSTRPFGLVIAKICSANNNKSKHVSSDDNNWQASLPERE
jgi:hypothetical protein